MSSPSDQRVLLGPLPLAAFRGLGRPVVSGFQRALAGGHGAVRVARAEALGLPRAASPLVKALVGWALDAGGGELIAPIPGLLTDHRAALSALPESWRVRLLPLLAGDRAACARAVQRAGGVPEGPGDDTEGGGALVETILREQETGARPSDRVAAWLRRLQEPGPPGDPGPAEPGGGRVPLLALGPWTLFEDLPARVESLGGRVVWDEEGAQGATLARAAEPAAALAAWPALDPALRLSGILAAAARTGARGVILVMEAFTGALLDELWLRGHLDLPLLALEVEAPGPLDPARRLRLEAFLGLVGGP
ncbi:MAG: hypothetical protein ABIK09_11130 [Pseudomonadota bacterium]